MQRSAENLTIIITLNTDDTIIIAVIQKTLGSSVFIVHHYVY